jgi:hypothetical protein
VTQHSTHSLLTRMQRDTHSLLSRVQRDTHSLRGVLPRVQHGMHSLLSRVQRGTHSLLSRTWRGAHSLLSRMQRGTHSLLLRMQRGTHSLLSRTQRGTHSLLSRMQHGTHSLLSRMQRGTHGLLSRMWRAMHAIKPVVQLLVVCAAPVLACSVVLRWQPCAPFAPAAPPQGVPEGTRPDSARSPSFLVPGAAAEDEGAEAPHAGACAEQSQWQPMDWQHIAQERGSPSNGQQHLATPPARMHPAGHITSPFLRQVQRVSSPLPAV